MGASRQDPKEVEAILLILPREREHRYIRPRRSVIFQADAAYICAERRTCT